MWLDILLLLTTLTVGLVGTITPITTSPTGKVVISTLLVISTTLSILIKRNQAKRNEAIEAGVRNLTFAQGSPRYFVQRVTKKLMDVAQEYGIRDSGGGSTMVMTKRQGRGISCWHSGRTHRAELTT
ncbi:hypothetical protein [Plantactinospora veratri]